MTDDVDSQGNKTITQLVNTHGMTRTYALSDGSFQERVGGTASWRHNNPGNLKLEYAHSADSTVHTHRTKEQALTSAKANYAGVVDLDQRGNVVFDTYDHGREAQIQFIGNGKNADKTVAEMLGNYSKPDYSGPTHYAQQEAAIYATGDKEGVDLRTKKIRDMSPKEMNALADGISSFEGWHKGKMIELTPQQAAERQAQQTHEDTPGHGAVGALRQGMHGEQVQKLQAQLGELGYLDNSGTPDGKFGPATRDAVKTFQHDHYLPEIGQAGPGTQRAMQAELQPLRQNSSGPLPAVSTMSSLPVVAPGLDDPRNAFNPNHGLYNELKTRIPDASESRLLQFTAACHENKITAGNLGAIHFDRVGGQMLFQGSSMLATPATVDLKTPSPEPQQSIQHIQQRDQQQAQMMGQIQTQNAQVNQQLPQGPMPGGLSH